MFRLRKEKGLLNRKVLITGGTGFIGRHLVEHLAPVQGCDVHVVTRKHGGRGDARNDRVGEFDISLLDGEAVGKAALGMDCLIHLAFDSNDLPSNHQILRNLAQAALMAKARLIHVSSMAVYEPLGGTTLDETAPYGSPQTRYAATKQALERELDGFVAQGLSAVVLQPAVVYGPRSTTWTDVPVRQLLRGELALPAEGLGLANLVYVTDVCEAINRAITATIPRGERILISGSKAETWGDYYGWLNGLVGRSSLRLLPSGVALSGRRYAAKRAMGLLADPEGPLVSRLPALATSKAAALLSAASRRARPVFYPPPSLAALYAARCSVSVEKSRQVLGFAPAISFERGKALTKAYIRTAYGNQIDKAA